MTVDPKSIKIDLSRDELFDHFARETLTDRYLVKNETSPQQAFARAAAAFGSNEAHAQRLYDYASKHWFMFATPLLSNGGTDRGLSISCFLNWVPDSRDGILDHYRENGWLASMGGGIGSYWGALRGRGETTSKGSRTSGVIPFTKIVDAQMLAFNQGATRRGSAAVYLDISHPETEEWIVMRKESGGDKNRKTFNLHHALNITDAFMRAVMADGLWSFMDPHSGRVTKMVKARFLWEQILEARKETGEPYLFFIDTANRALPKPMRDAGFKIYSSNLCTEITLPTGPDPRDGLMRTAVCCLSSTNLAKFDEWQSHPHFIPDLMEMLDNCLEDFIAKAPPAHAAAVRSAQRERSVGLGAMGFHTYLQRNGIPMSSPLARTINRQMFRHLRDQALTGSRVLGKLRGEAPDMAGTGLRFAHTMAIAPNASSSIFCGGISPGVEPRVDNAYLHKTLSGSFPVKNPTLQRELAKMGRDTHETWQSIIAAKGSVQHLDFLSEQQKLVFQTAFEMDQMVVVRLAADRTPFIDQAQSINLFFDKDATAREVSRAHLAAWQLGVKSLYYMRTETVKRAKLIGLEKDRREVSAAPEVCLACEG